MIFAINPEFHIKRFHQALFFHNKSFFLKFFIQNPFDVSNFERIKEDDLSKIPDENSGWDAEF